MLDAVDFLISLILRSDSNWQLPTGTSRQSKSVKVYSLTVLPLPQNNYCLIGFSYRCKLLYLWFKTIYGVEEAWLQQAQQDQHGSLLLSLPGWDVKSH